MIKARVVVCFFWGEDDESFRTVLLREFRSEMAIPCVLPVGSSIELLTADKKTDPFMLTISSYSCDENSELLWVFCNEERFGPKEDYDGDIAWIEANTSLRQA